MIESEFSYEKGSGVVTYDPEATDPEIFIAELADKTGFQGRVVEASGAAGQERAPNDGRDGRAEEHDPSHSNR